MMIQIDDKIVSSELLTERFCCDLSHCKGICCVEGNAGAPLEIDEVEVLEHEWEAYRPYMKPEGIEAVERQGFMVLDEDGDLTTPLIGEAECAYSFEENGVTMCAIERAWREADFVPPVSDPAHYSEQRNRRPQLPPMGRLRQRKTIGTQTRHAGLPHAARADRPSLRRTVLRSARRSGTLPERNRTG